MMNPNHSRVLLTTAVQTKKAKECNKPSQRPDPQLMFGRPIESDSSPIDTPHVENETLAWKPRTKHRKGDILIRPHPRTHGAAHDEESRKAVAEQPKPTQRP